VVPFEHHIDASATGYFAYEPKRNEQRSAPWAAAGAIGGGLGIGCRGRPWAPFLRATLAGGYDGSHDEAYGKLRLGAGYRHTLNPLLLETSITAGPVLTRWGHGGGGGLTVGLGLPAGSGDKGAKYTTFDHLMIEAVIDLRTLEQRSDAFVIQRRTQLFFGLRLRALRRRVPRCWGPGPNRFQSTRSIAHRDVPQ
jgi:hypothetical protein